MCEYFQGMAENVAWQKLQINDKENRYDKRHNRIVNMTLEFRSN